MRPVAASSMAGTSKPGDAVHVQGVCTAAESVHMKVASRVVKCLHCEAAQAYLQAAGVPLAKCCAESGSGPTAWEEDVTGRVFIPVRGCWPSP